MCGGLWLMIFDAMYLHTPLSPPGSQHNCFFSQQHRQQNQRALAFHCKTAVMNSLCTNIYFKMQDCSFAVHKLRSMAHLKYSRQQLGW